MKKARRRTPVPVGAKFNLLTVVGESDAVQFECRTLRCICECGTEVVVGIGRLRRGNVKSCGCINHKNKKHGLKGTRIYKIWSGIKERCIDKDNKLYGGRGITVCERWMNSVEAFVADMGPCPSPVHQIDRIDNNGNYEPWNCRWATPTQQARNRRNSRTVEAFGEAKNLKAWTEDDRCVVRYDVLLLRIIHGWNPERAMTHPVRKQRNNHRMFAEPRP